MSDTSMGPGWWLASDGKWYPPEQAPPTVPSAPPAPAAPTLARSATMTAPPPQVTYTTQPPPGYKLKKKRRWPWVVLVLVALIAIAAAVAGTVEEEPGEQPAAGADGATSAQPVAPLTVGSADSTSGFDVTLLQVVDPWTSTNQFEAPAAGSRFVAVELDMVNTTGEIQTFSTLLGLELIDSLGQRWNPSLAGVDLPRLDGDVAPGRNIRGWQVFEVPADAAGMRLKVAGSLTASGIEFQL